MTLWIYAQSEAPQAVKKLSMQERREMVHRQTGGLVWREKGEGSFLILDIQKQVSREVIDAVIKDVSRAFSFSSKVVQLEETDAPRAIRSQLAKAEIGMVIALTDIPNEEGLLLAPESRWAIVNISRLAEGKPSKEKIDERFRKEIWRAIGYLMGGNNQSSKASLLHVNKGGQDLDQLNNVAMDPAIFANIVAVAKAWNLKLCSPTTYRNACEEGWAPMPTNNFQKAIMEEVKAKKATTPKPAVTK
jgi:hypothetical protein